MTDTPPRKKHRVCACSGTTKEQILELIESGVDDFDSISRTTGACSGCGACEGDILDLLEEHAAPTPRQPAA